MITVGKRARTSHLHSANADAQVGSRSYQVLFACQETRREIFGVARVLVGRRPVRVVVGLVRVREWPVRRAGVAGCEPAALESESFPVCPPGPFWATRRASSTIRASRASLMRRFRARRASLPVLPSAILRS